MANMNTKIYEAVLNTGTGSITQDGYTYKYDYLVITDNDATPETIYADAKSVGLPRVGDASPVSSRKVTNVSIDRWDENNMGCVPSFNLPKKASGSYTAWKYEIECGRSSSDSGSSSSSSSSSVKEAKELAKKKLAVNFSTSTKEYNVTTNLVLKSIQNPEDEDVIRSNVVPITHAPIPERKELLTTPTGDAIITECTEKNIVISFTYYIEGYANIPYLFHTYLYTTNAVDITVAGIDIPAHKGVIRNISFHNLIDDETNEEALEVSVEIEIQIEHSVLGYYVIHTGYHARLLVVLGSYPIHELTVSPESKIYKALITGNTYDKWFFDKERFLGTFSGLSVKLDDGSSYVLQPGIDYTPITEPKILDKDGFVYKGAEGGSYNIDDPNIGKTFVYEVREAHWVGLKLPVKAVKQMKQVTSWDIE